MSLVILVLSSFPQHLLADSLSDRIAAFPNWNSKPSVSRAKEDLEYPQWMAGTWQASSTLVEQVAPLAPDIISPGFEDNEKYLNREVSFPVRFGKEYFIPQKSLLPFFAPKTETPVVADRVFNGENIAKAYLGDNNVYKVKTDPENPNKQITLLRGERRLISTVSLRGTEKPSSTEFISTEVTQQLFKSPERIYLNEVETTSDYQLINPETIKAEQITAIYLSPQDPDFFRAGDRPVAIYRYKLSLQKQ